MPVRNSTAFFYVITAGLLFLASMFVHAAYRQRADVRSLTAKRELVRKLELTDLSLFTDARYTRHPAMADLFSAFQDHPFSLEHFPSGSLLGPPPHLMRHP
ncbi:MAG: hypothetical protein EHM51_02555 [Geobacter sp.]|nr:MAG: hypothetical protein EHM51_02555 [Geobacter sp.]